MGVAVGRFVDCLRSQDFDGMGRECHVDARLRALEPTGLRESVGRNAIIGRFQEWFGACDPLTLEQARLGDVGGLTWLAYRLRLVDPVRGACVVEQHAFLLEDDAGIRWLDLVCSGFQRVPTIAGRSAIGSSLSPEATLRGG